jgi:hypothetical protein
MNWFEKFARSDIERIRDNIQRLESLKSRVHDLGYFAVASNSGGFQALNTLTQEQLVRGRPKVLAKLEEALVGENNQKVALDAPTRFQRIMTEAEELIQTEIGKEQRELRELVDTDE